MCLEFATFDWSNYRLWAGIRRRPNLNFLNELENDRAFGRLPNSFNKLFPAWQPSSCERTTENLVSEKPGDAALWMLCSPRIRGISSFPQQARHYFRLARDPPAIKGKAQQSGIEACASALTLPRPDIQGTPLD